MPRFAYVALDKGGTEKTGTLEMGSQNEAISRLKEMGLYPTSVTEEQVEVDKQGKKVVGKKKKKAGFEIVIPSVKTHELCTSLARLRLHRRSGPR